MKTATLGQIFVTMTLLKNRLFVKLFEELHLWAIENIHPNYTLIWMISSIYNEEACRGGLWVKQRHN